MSLAENEGEIISHRELFVKLLFIEIKIIVKKKAYILENFGKNMKKDWSVYLQAVGMQP